MDKVDIVCADCGSNSTSSSSVTAYWDAREQRYDYDHYDDRVYCSHCGDDGRNVNVPYYPDRWALRIEDFERGDMVKFQPDMREYDELIHPDEMPDITPDTLGVVVEWDDDVVRGRAYGDMRDTVAVRLMTGELLEVWPRDLIKLEDK